MTTDAVDEMIKKFKAVRRKFDRARTRTKIRNLEQSVQADPLLQTYLAESCLRGQLSLTPDSARSLAKNASNEGVTAALFLLSDFARADGLTAEATELYRQAKDQSLCDSIMLLLNYRTTVKLEDRLRCTENALATADQAKAEAVGQKEIALRVAETSVASLRETLAGRESRIKALEAENARLKGEIDARSPTATEAELAEARGQLESCKAQIAKAEHARHEAEKATVRGERQREKLQEQYRRICKQLWKMGIRLDFSFGHGSDGKAA